jgi:hypothetical protein
MGGGAVVVATRGRKPGETARADRLATGGSKPGGISGAGRRGARGEVLAVVRWIPMVETVGPDSQRKSRSVRLSEATRGKLSSSKNHMSGDYQAVYREIKAAIAFVVDRVAQEDTPGGAWGELMWCNGSCVRVARTTKDVQMLVGGRRTKQGKMRTRSLDRCCGKTV